MARLGMLGTAKRLFDNTRHQLDIQTIALESLMASHTALAVELEMKCYRDEMVERIVMLGGDQVDTEGMVAIHELVNRPQPRGAYIGMIRRANRRLHANRPDANMEKDTVYDYNLEPAHTYCWS